MVHSEWKNDKELVERLLKKAGLYDVSMAGELKTAMRWIIWYKYVDLMTENEILARLYVEHNIDLSTSKYYRILREAVHTLEKYV